MARASKEIIKAAVMGFGIPAVLLALAMLVLVPKRESQYGLVEETRQTVPSTETGEPLSQMTIPVWIEGVV